MTMMQSRDYVCAHPCGRKFAAARLAVAAAAERPRATRRRPLARQPHCQAGTACGTPGRWLPVPQSPPRHGITVAAWQCVPPAGVETT